jgi:hypothetical protein
VKRVEGQEAVDRRAICFDKVLQQEELDVTAEIAKEPKERCVALQHGTKGNTVQLR